MAAVVQAELKQAVQERKAVEGRVVQLEAYTAGLKDQKAQIDRLREVWGEWSGALAVDAGLVVKARSVLKLILASPIWVRPVVVDGTQEWKFAGLARYDRVLDGGVAHDGYYIESRPVTEPVAVIDWFAQAAGDIPRRPASRQITVRSISGSSDLGVDEGRATSGPPTSSEAT